MSTAATTQQYFSRDLMRQAAFPLALAVVLALNFLGRTGHDEQRVNEIAFLLFAGFAVTVSASASLTTFLAGTAGGRSLALFFACGIAGAAMAYSPRHAAVEIALFLLLLAVALAVAAQIERGGKPVLLLALQAAAGAAVLHALRIVGNLVISYAMGERPTPTDFIPGFTNIRFLNHTQTVLLPLVVLLVCQTPAKSPLRALWLGLASLWWTAIFVTTGRGTVLGVLAGCVFAGIVLRRAALPYLKALALTIAGGIVIYIIVCIVIPTLSGQAAFNALDYVVERTRSDPSSRRFFIWGNAIEMIRQHPWFGVGPMHFAHDAARFQWAAHPHDWILQIAVEWGLPALACLGFALWRGMGALVSMRDSVKFDDDRLILSALSVTGAAILVDSLVSGLIVMPQSQLAIALYLGLAIGWYRLLVPNRSPAPAESGAMRRTGALILLAAMVGLANGSYSDVMGYLNDGVAASANATLNNGSFRWPRLWESGFF